MSQKQSTHPSQNLHISITMSSHRNPENKQENFLDALVSQLDTDTSVLIYVTIVGPQQRSR